MKRVASFLLSLVLIIGSASFLEAKAANPIAIPTTSSVVIDGITYRFDAYNIDDYHYFKLRDLAYALSNTYKPFSVGWDDSTGTITLTKNERYTPTGGELDASFSSIKEAKPTSHKLLIDGSLISCTAYNIDELNYFKLRDIGANIDFSIAWDESTDSITIDTYYGYYDQAPDIALSPTPAVSPAPAPSLYPLPSASPSPTITPELSPTITPEPSLTVTPEPSPTSSPDPSPTSSPTPSPTSSPTPSPTSSPTPSPTSSPTPSPTDSPTPAETLAGIKLGDSVSDADSILGSPYKVINGLLEYRFYGPNSHFVMVGAAAGIVEYVYSNYGFEGNSYKFTDSNAGDAVYACDIGSRKSESDARIAEEIIFEATNAFRGFNGLSALSYNEPLHTAARLHSEDQVAQDYFSHTSLDGRTMSERAAAQGYGAGWMGENIAYQHSAVGVNFVNSWINSSGHRDNILRDYIDFGVGFAIGSSCIATQMFGR
jgi:uncharacterized protein YkwD